MLTSYEFFAMDDNHLPKCVNLPSFTGEDPVGWLTKAEMYFMVQNTPPKM